MSLYSTERPRSFDDVVGRDDIITKIKENILPRRRSEGLLPPHFLFDGPPGSGKTLMAECIASEWFGPNWRAHFHMFNASSDRKIEFIRNRIIPLLQSSGDKGILLDEADNLTEDSQEALRQPMQDTKHTFVILTCNSPQLLLPALRSRCTEFVFNPLPQKDVQSIIKGYLRKINFSWNDYKPDEVSQIKDGLNELIKQSNGDLRRALNALDTLIGANKKINVKSIQEFLQPSLAPQILTLALQGNFDKALQTLEDALVLSKSNTSKMIMDFHVAIPKVIQSQEIRMLAYKKLGEVEQAILMGGTPVIQLGDRFLSEVWVAPHLSKTVEN